MRRQANSVAPGYVRLQINHPFLHAFSTAFTAPGYDHSWAEQQFAAAHAALKTGALHDIHLPDAWTPKDWGESDEDYATRSAEHKQRRHDALDQVRTQVGDHSLDDYDAQQRWHSGVRRALTLGHLSIDEAKQRGFRPADSREAGTEYTDDDYQKRTRGGWQPLPPKVFHVSTHADDVQRDGLKTRQELGGVGTGLGGGHGMDQVSVTADEKLGPDIYHGLHEHHAYLNGKITTDQLLDYAKHPPVGKPFHDELTHSISSDVIEKARTGTEHYDLPTLSDYHKDKPGWEPSSHFPEGHPLAGQTQTWSRRLGPEEQLHARTEMYKGFAYMRGSHFGGQGHRNPLFMSNDPVAFAKTDPAKFGILHLRSHPGAQGFPLDGAHGKVHDGADSGEWRLGPGSPFDVEKVDKPRPRHLDEFGLGDKTGAYETGPDGVRRSSQDRNWNVIMGRDPHDDGNAPPRQAPKPVKHKIEDIDDRTYSVRDVDRANAEGGLDTALELEGHKHEPEKATFRLQRVPVDSLRSTQLRGGQVVKRKAWTVPEMIGHGDDYDEMEHERINSIREGGEHVPPIVVVKHGPHHVIVDGAHRAGVAMENGESHVPAFVTDRDEGVRRQARVRTANQTGREREWRSGNEFAGSSPEDIEKHNADEWAPNIRDHGPYRLVHQNPTYGSGQITAHVQDSRGWKGVGYLSYTRRHDQEGTPTEIHKVQVHPDHQRQGLASAMLDLARESHPEMQHSHALSDDGRAWAEKKAVQAPPPGLSFEYRERNSGGMKWPIFHTILAHAPDVEQPVGRLTYFTHPRRKSQGIYVDGMDVHPDHQRQGIGSALMDEMQRQHPDHKIDHGARTDDGKAWWSGYTDGKTVRRGRTAGLDDDDYRMQHRPPGRDGIPIHDMTVNLPADIYTHPHYYSDMSEPTAQHAHRIINQVRGKPDARVHIYRALPAEHAHQGFRPGDWVTTSKDYARQHGTHAVDPKHDWPVIHTVVKADDLHTDGDDFREFGYNGTETKPGNVAFKGGYHQEISDRAEGGVRQVQRRQGPLTGKGYSFTAEHDHIGGTGGTIRAWHHDDYAGHMHYNADGSPEEPHIEPEHQHLAEELTRRMRMKLPPRTGAVDHEVWYHGTSAEGAEHVQRDGLTAPPGVMPSAWPMVTTSREQAARYAPSRPGSKVIEFHIPKHLTNYRNEGSVLWPADEHNVYGYAARAAGPKGTIPPSMIHAVHDVDDPSSKTASTRRKQASRVVPCTHCKGRGTFSNDKGQSWACPTCHGDKTLEQADHWDPPELPQEQREAQGAEDHRDYSAKSLQLAKNPVPGTVVWRGEFRHKDDLHRPPSVGMHWSVKPEQATALHPPTEMIPEDHHKVLWEARIDDPEKQTIPRSHPVWSGRHRSMDSEAEVRFKPGTRVHLQAAYLHDGRPGRSMLAPLHSDRSAAGWTKHPMGVEVPIEHKRDRDDGMMAYQEHFPDLFKNASMRMVRPSQVWDHIRTDVHPHRLDTIRDSVAEHGWQPDWNVADGPIKVSLDPPAVSNGSHRLHVLRELGRDDPIPMQVTGSLPGGYSLRTREDPQTERWGLPAYHVDVHHSDVKGPVGSLSVHQREINNERVGHPNIYVEPEHRHKGLATAMYAEVHRRWPDVPIEHSEHASDAARGLNQALQEQFGPDLHRTASGQVFYHGSMQRFEKGTVLTPDKRADGSIHSGDWVYATTDPESARYFASMHDTSPESDSPVHIHRVEPIGDVEPDVFLGERDKFSQGNYRAKALRVLDHHQVPGHWAKQASLSDEPDWYHVSDSPIWQHRAGEALHVGEGHAAVHNDMVNQDGRAFLHRFRYVGRPFNTPEHPAIDYVANHAYHQAHGGGSGPMPSSHSDPMNSDHWQYLQWEHEAGKLEDPREHVDKHVQAARQGLGIHYLNSHEGTRPTVSLVAPSTDFEHLGVEPLSPEHQQRFASLSDEDRVSVAEQAMERGGHTGRSWHVPAMHRDDPAREEAQRPVHEFVNGVLSEYGRGPVRVSPKHWDLRSPGSGRALYDHTYGTIGLKGEDTNDLELLHEMAHALTGKPGHDREFVQVAHDLYQDHLGPEAAQTFRNVVEPQRHEAATEWQTGHCEPGMKCKDMTLPTSYLMKGNQYVSDDEDEAESPENEHNWRRAWRYSEQMKKSDAWHSPDWDPEPHVDSAFRDSPGQVHVHVNKKGQPSLLDGNHRTIAAEIADIPEIPNVHVTAHPDAIARLEKQRQATRTTPHDRVFGPTYGLDVRLWENEKLREPIRDDIIARWRTFCLQHRYRDWSSWVKIVFFGSEASEWTGPGQIGNGDFDLSIGIEYDRFRATNPNYAQMADAEIATMFTGQMHAELNDPAHAFPDTEGSYDNTWFANLQGYHIERMRPYAAYDVIARQWIVKPPHLPDWDVSKLPVPMRRILRAAETTARNTLKLREPDRTLQAARLYDMWHADRSNAFGEQGEGWYDIGNLREKYLDQLGLWGPLAQAHHRAAELAPLQWDNTPHFAKLPESEKCKYCKQQATQRVIHSEGMAYVPTCDEHLDKAKHDAARCTPDGSVDPSNIDAVRKIANYADYLRGGGLDQMADRVYSQPQHHVGDHWNTPQYPGTVGWVKTDEMRQMRHHDGTQNARSPEVTHHLTEGFKHGEGWLSPLQLNYAAEDHKVWLGEGNHRLEAAHRAGEEYVPVTIAHTQSGHLPSEYRAAPFTRKVNTYSEMKGLRGQSGDTIHPAHILPSHWLHPNSTLPGRTASLYHWAPKEYRDDIEQHGLDHTRSPFYDPNGHGPHGIFLHHTPELAHDWAPGVDRTHDLYEVDAQGMKLHPDPYDTDAASYTSQPVPPERIHRVGARRDPHHGEGPWFHGSNADLKPGDQLLPGDQVGEKSHGQHSDGTRVWVSNDPWRASSYGHRTYAVEPHSRPRSPYANHDEHHTTGATVLHEVDHHGQPLPDRLGSVN